MPLPSRSHYKSLLTSLIALISLGVIWAGVQLSWNKGLRDLRDSNRQQLDQFISHLEARLARFEFVPQLIAKNRLLDELLMNPQDSNLTETVNRFLEDINDVIGASDSYLMDRNGLTLAASNWQDEKPFVGKNFSFRPYFVEAMQGGQGRYFALGSTSDRRGYYFSYPVTDTAGQIGVVVIKMDLSNIEQHWSGRKVQFIVSDPDGVIFITTRRDWLYRALKPIDDENLQRIHLSQRYPDQDIQPLRYSVEQSFLADSRMFQFQKPIGAQPENYLNLEQNMPQAGWSVMILAPLDDIRRNALITAVILALLIVLVLLTAFLAWTRHKRRQERERFREDAQRQLEQEVSLRTADLRREVDDHKRTAQTLRDTQGELLQTAKLAVLGQMSASISHELNNPLAAIRSYADNARQFLSMEKTRQVDDNLTRIAGLTEQMAKISSQLKFFARKSSGTFEAVNIQPVIQSAIDLVAPQFKNTGFSVEVAFEQPDLTARADIIQLEQVLINLINNAMNAMEESDLKKVQIRARREDDQVIIDIDDSGTGISESNLEKIFDPFFTTRKSGLGLGLSISARIMDNMQGSLSAKNRAEGGARFTIRLQSAA